MIVCRRFLSIWLSNRSLLVGRLQMAPRARQPWDRCCEPRAGSTAASFEVCGDDLWKRWPC
jgi:hypothetical protein